MIKPWPTLSSKVLGKFRVFTLRSDEKVSPRTGQKHEFYVLESVDWVNVIALTRDGSLVMVEQYRHGSDSIELEVPGGVMDAEDASPVLAGLRELREETGYEGENPRLIGSVFANPAILNNTCHTLLLENCERRHPTLLDQSEDILTRLVRLDEIPALMKEGRIRHSLVVAALHHFELWRTGRMGTR